MKVVDCRRRERASWEDTRDCGIRRGRQEADGRVNDLRVCFRCQRDSEMRRRGEKCLIHRHAFAVIKTHRRLHRNIESACCDDVCGGRRKKIEVIRLCIVVIVVIVAGVAFFRDDIDFKLIGKTCNLVFLAQEIDDIAAAVFIENEGVVPSEKDMIESTRERVRRMQRSGCQICCASGVGVSVSKDEQGQIQGKEIEQYSRSDGCLLRQEELNLMLEETRRKARGGG